MCGCECWIIKKAERRGIDAFELWYWRRLLRVPGTTRRSNQSFLKEISPEYSLKGLILKLKLQYFAHLMWRTESLKKTLMLGKIEGGRRRGRQKMRWLDSITDSMDMSFPYFLQFKSEFGNKEFMVWATVSSWSCFCWLYRASLAAKNIINLISVLTIWWCPCVESSLVLLEEGVCYDQCIFLAKLC